MGTIIEAQLDKGRGPVATVIVQTGTLKVGDIVVAGNTYGKVKALESSTGKRITKAGPATAAVILGLSDVPEAGDVIRVVADEKIARTQVETRKNEAAAREGAGAGRATLEDLYRQMQAGQAKELRIILKSDVSGSLGAIDRALGQLSSDETKINVLLEAAGDITDNDIMLATASNAIVVGFNTGITDTARRAAEAEGVDVRLYDIIYKLTDDIDAALKGMLEPEMVEVDRGPGRGPPDLQGRQEHGHRRLLRHRRPHRPQRRCPRVARRQDRRDRPDRVAPAVPGRRPRGRPELRVRHRPRGVQRPRRGRHHRVLHHAGAQPDRRLTRLTGRSAVTVPPRDHGTDR